MRSRVLKVLSNAITTVMALALMLGLVACDSGEKASTSTSSQQKAAAKAEKAEEARQSRERAANRAERERQRRARLEARDGGVRRNWRYTSHTGTFMDRASIPYRTWAYVVWHGTSKGQGPIDWRPVSVCVTGANQPKGRPNPRPWTFQFGAKAGYGDRRHDFAASVELVAQRQQQLTPYYHERKGNNRVPKGVQCFAAANRKTGYTGVVVTIGRLIVPADPPSNSKTRVERAENMGVSAPNTRQQSIRKDDPLERLPAR